jgi:hypothetical protein
MNYLVRVDDLSDDELSFFGWEVLDKGEEFSIYSNARYNETQPVSNESPRYLLIDDRNDAQVIGRGRFLVGPRNPH